MEGNNLMAFTTYDEENDLNPDKNCAVERLGGWWFNDCSLSSLTGNHSSTDIGKISWKTWTSNDRITGAEMKIRTSSGKEFVFVIKYELDRFRFPTMPIPQNGIKC
jgi:hypothetical protein